MFELVYPDFHDPKGQSRIDRAFRDVISGDVRIACPYLAVSYVKSLLRDTTSFRLVTDVGACFDASRQREALLKWMLQHEASIRHFSLLHAKTVISASGAVVGSANLTTRAVRKRVEMVMRIRDTALHRQLADWFETLWENSTRIDPEQLRRGLAYLPARPPEAPNARRAEGLAPHNRLGFCQRIGAGTRASGQRPLDRARRSTGSRQGRPGTTPSDREHLSRAEIRDRLAHFADRERVEFFFECAQVVYRLAEERSEGERLCLTLPSDDYLSLQVNNRYVLLVNKRNARKCNGAIMYPADAKTRLDNDAPRWLKEVTAFDPRPSKARRDTAPIYVKFDFPFALREDAALRTPWLDAVKAELQRRSWRAARAHHERLLERMLRDAKYRARILNEAFPGRRT